MKKLLLYIILLCLIAGFFACSNSNNTGALPLDKNQTSANPADTENDPDEVKENSVLQVYLQSPVLKAKDDSEAGDTAEESANIYSYVKSIEVMHENGTWHTILDKTIIFNLFDPKLDIRLSDKILPPGKYSKIKFNFKRSLLVDNINLHGGLAGEGNNSENVQVILDRGFILTCSEVTRLNFFVDIANWMIADESGNIHITPSLSTGKYTTSS